jgi:hypothetical protein
VPTMGVTMRFPGAVVCLALASCASFAVLCGLQPVQAQSQYVQKGPKLIGSGAVGIAVQGRSVALSADGNTAIVGGPDDNSRVGATWVFIREGSDWVQQGPKLVGSGAVGAALQGLSTALSADGNTAIVGGPGDNSGVGAAWVFVRDGSVWIEQQKLVGTDSVGAVGQGTSVALSADGNTAIVGGPDTGSLVDTGAAWVFTRSGPAWTQQGPKLVGTGSVVPSEQGISVALSADGNTAIVGGDVDNGLGAAWVFTRTGVTWTQQGAKLVGTGSTADSQGSSVALSADGNTAIVGGPNDNSFVGATWVFTRIGGVWSQQGPKLVGTGGIGNQGQGNAVALSGDGNTVIVGGELDNNDAGAAWVFTRSSGVWNQRGGKLVGRDSSGEFLAQGISVALSGDGRTAMVGASGDFNGVGATLVFALVGAHDFNADSRSDVVWRHVDGDVALWLMNGTQMTPGPVYGPIPSVWSIVGQRDFNGDGNADVLWRDTSGNVAIWEMNGTTILNANSSYVANVATNWNIVGTGDFNDDSMGDLLWQDTSGNVAIWEMKGTTVLNQNSSFVANVASQWSIKGTGDFNGDGKADILWQDPSGNVAIWEMNGTTILNANTSFVDRASTNWSIVGTGDFNNDGKADVLWRDTSGNVHIWEMDGTTILNGNSFLANVPGQWSVALTGDFDGDGNTDLFWRDTSGNMAIWFLSGVQVMSAANLGNLPTNWTVQSVNAE